MEYQNDIQNSEFITGNSEGETNEYRVKDDTKLQDKYGCHLGGKFLGLIMRLLVIKMMFITWRIIEISLMSRYLT